MLALLDATIIDLSEALQTGKLSAVSLTKAYIARINQVNDYFRAVIEINPDALSIAEELDAEQRASGRRGLVFNLSTSTNSLFD